MLKKEYQGFFDSIEFNPDTEAFCNTCDKQDTIYMDTIFEGNFCSISCIIEMHRQYNNSCKG